MKTYGFNDLSKAAKGDFGFPDKMDCSIYGRKSSLGQKKKKNGVYGSSMDSSKKRRNRRVLKKLARNGAKKQISKELLTVN